MSEQPSEEKSLPASDKKLRDVREKGQVDKSSDMVTAVVMLGCTLYLFVSAGMIEARVRSLITLTTRLYLEPFDTAWPRLVAVGVEVLVYSILPLIVITVVAAVLTNILIMRGMLFSIEPIKPKFEHINPAEGVKRIFSARGMIEFFKSLLKIVTLGVAFLVVCRLGLQALMESARCGMGCLEGIFLALLKPLVITALVVFLVVGLIDVKMQRWLFRRDQRMTRSEQKRERKDIEGDPEIRKARQRQRRDTHGVSTRTGVEQASIMIGAEGDWLVGIRYVRGETPVPVVVCRAAPEDSASLRRKAEERRLKVVENRELAGRIGRRAGNGEAVPGDVFQSVADILVAAKLI
ncbi:EscU/YscU/HrcU family type III secretion system export apparatus switch protein [Halomonas sp. SpR8]|uniref:EscU/YscU/HrcU family type III secretion system export apparatus switch protein n=1 Tax=Halomonas sp. SpR8 TaxID=3050463 RepID=UPI0027E59BF9|nr:EscU/YscU/HrcU family type III secretion system export apparatus switch protein [Halomonas sp. SpR8]MDQ7729760.1 EscU/YscU/HrcU family type III secretion system export apparatus switch protein [Halomonas sp. SpR8]